ncbi:hypothetical protein Rs2_40011 [Raphanus sativus]|nr:hypothetical protein Rs2_40011 [Raphanus sativus]
MESRLLGLKRNVRSSFPILDLRRKLHDGGAWLSGSPLSSRIYHPMWWCDEWRSESTRRITVTRFGSRRRGDARLHTNGVVNRRNGPWWRHGEAVYPDSGGGSADVRWYSLHTIGS